ncbi:MAG: malto-oligosyltrehalose trehalohydrolase [Gemmatimonadota bacterium]|nr:malto-oligosyltrehalose trehalohydrolase [Gemmatimonadota bacterium]
MSTSVPQELTGALPVEGGVAVRVWAPEHRTVEVVVYGPNEESLHPLAPEGDGYFSAVVEGLRPGARYRYRLDEGDTFPDPASRSQPEGVHGPSEVVDPAAFRWTDDGWRGIPLEEMVIYELHVGTATPEGTFDSLIERLDHVVELGATAVEIMPVAEFSGKHNWGYDGVDLYAPSSAYGGPEGLRRLVDAAHARGLAVILDVVYNHFGPEGNYLYAVTGGRFFTDRHKTPWGDAINYDGEGSRAVRDFVVRNAVHWAEEYHMDGLRLDATHAIIDDSPVHVLTEVVERVRATLPRERHFVFIAEDERNERRLITPVEEGGVGIDGVWADDFHHQMRRLTAGDSESYFADFSGTTEDVAATLRKGWFYEGQLSRNHGARRGAPAEGLAPPKFVHHIQNHDQVGNRAMGDRLSDAVPLPVYRAASALLLLSPYTPMLWMGQEWAASTPFQYFTDHPAELGKLVTEGRREEFGKFSAFSDPEMREKIPDPQSPETFRRSKLRWEEVAEAPHAGILALYRELLMLRCTHPALRERARESFTAAAFGEQVLVLRRSAPDGSALLLVCSLGEGARLELSGQETRPPVGPGWELLLSTEEGRFGGEEGEVAHLSPDGVLELRGAGAVLLRAAGGGGVEQA